MEFERAPGSVTRISCGIPCPVARRDFSHCSYNVENYLDQPTETRRYAKSAEARVKIRESIHALKPDVIALEEMGTTNALLELRASLKAEEWIFLIGSM